MGIGNIFIDSDEIEKKERRQQLDNLIANAKWNMYAELWGPAENSLHQAKAIAVFLHEKQK